MEIKIIFGEQEVCFYDKHLLIGEEQWNYSEIKKASIENDFLGNYKLKLELTGLEKVIPYGEEQAKEIEEVAKQITKVIMEKENNQMEPTENEDSPTTEPEGESPIDLQGEAAGEQQQSIGEALREDSTKLEQGIKSDLKEKTKGLKESFKKLDKKKKAFCIIGSILLVIIILGIIPTESKSGELVVSYFGSYTEGTMIDEKNDGLSVSEKDKNGNTKSVLSGWKVENPSKLEKDKTKTYTISYKGKKGDVKIKGLEAKKKTTAETSKKEEPKAPAPAPQPQQTEEEKKQDYISRCGNADYTELARNPDSYVGQCFQFTGRVLQVQESTYGNVYRISTNAGTYGSYYDDVVYTIYIPPSGASRILEDDMVTMYGEF
ncbi:MAG: hypothetical protein RR626_06545, partial [Anaerovoracaceae bacterium]